MTTSSGRVTARAFMGVIGVAALIGAAALVALAPSDDSGLQLLGGVAASGLVLPPLVAGSFAAVWGWDPLAHRRLRVAVAVLAAAQVVAGVGFVLVARAVGLGMPAVVAALVSTVVLDVVLPLLGRAARPPVRATPRPQDELSAEIRRSWRRGAVGAIVGLVVGTGLVAWMVLPSDGSDDLRFLLLLPAGPAAGASIAILPSFIRASRRVRDLLGDRYSSTVEIGRAIKGEPVELPPDDAERARRWAEIGPSWVRLQLGQQGAGLLTSVSVIASLGVQDPELRWTLAVGGALVATAVVAGAVTLRRSTRRFRAYTAAHPV